MPITFKNAWQTLGEEWFCTGEVMTTCECKVFICPACYEPAVAVLVYRGGKANEACTSCTSNHVIPFSKNRFSSRMVEMFVKNTPVDEWDNPVYIDANHWIEQEESYVMLYKKGGNKIKVGDITHTVEFSPLRDIDAFVAA